MTNKRKVWSLRLHEDVIKSLSKIQGARSKVETYCNTLVENEPNNPL